MSPSSWRRNALGFSLAFDPAILSNPQATLGSDASSATLNTNSIQVDSGCYGIALALPAGQTFAAGTREIVVVSFLVDSSTSADSTVIEFKDQPIAREVVDAKADTLSASWKSGTVRISHGLEADVAPRPDGNGKVTIADWVQVGRFVALLDTPRTDVNEFQRADCALKTCGNGQISIADWVQAGRYAAGLDTLVPACGPISPTSSNILASGNFSAGGANILKTTGARAVRIDSARCKQGEINKLIIRLEAQGDENALGFSLSFDPAVLTFDSVAPGNGASGAFLNVNTSQKDAGRLGVALALSAGQTFASGSHEILSVTFKVDSNATTGPTTVAFGDQPIVKEIVDASANTLTADWIVGRVEIITSIAELAGYGTPQSFSLSQNYPNPFNPTTMIEFSLPRSDHVSLKIFDLLGKEVAVLVDEPFAAGRYKVDWDASGLVSGVYLYQLRAGNFVQRRKMLLVR